MAKDKELADHERAHSGVPGSKVRHGADAVGKPGRNPNDNWVRNADYEINPGFARMLDAYEGLKPRK